MNVKQLKLGVFLISLLPAIWLIYALFTHQLGVNPIETLTRETGLWALKFLVLTLTITPLRWLVGWNFLASIRRMLGLYVFFYALIHMLLYLWLDQFFDIEEIIKDIIKRPFITIGFFTFSALIPLVVTSNNAMVKKIGGKRWKRLHKLTYFIAVASCIHFYMLVKADKLEPLQYGLVVFILLAIRLYKYYFKQASIKVHTVKT
ncbi:MAG: sulfoxide reductase heme-binding subunit YedZ [Methylophaga sp.]|nr:MAG: sulfoxide reductase heme-binding subunit YedZ [Methylophaga sp.]